MRDAIRGSQRFSEATEVIEGNQTPSEAIRGNQRPSKANERR